MDNIYPTLTYVCTFLDCSITNSYNPSTNVNPSSARAYSFLIFTFFTFFTYYIVYEL